MQAVVFQQIRKFALIDVEIPDINDNEVLIKNSFAGFKKRFGRRNGFKCEFS